MTWLMILAFYTHGHLAHVESAKFSTQYSCNTAGKQIADTFTSNEDSVKYLCVKSLTKKSKKVGNEQ